MAALSNDLCKHNYLLGFCTDNTQIMDTNYGIFTKLTYFLPFCLLPSIIATHTLLLLSHVMNPALDIVIQHHSHLRKVSKCT